MAGGGIGDGPISEAAVIARLVMAGGVDPDAVLLEDRSRSTREQAERVAEILGAGAPVVVVTDRYHLPRALFLMRREGLAVSGSGCGRDSGSRWRWWAGAVREIPAFAKDVAVSLARGPRRILRG